MRPSILQNNLLGILSCLAFVVSAILFWHTAHRVLFMYPNWVLAFGASAFVGLILGIVGIASAVRKKQSPVYSAIGLVLNGALLGFAMFVIALGAMH